MNDSEIVAALRKKLSRLEKSRIEAEHLLEEKSEQLFKLNQDLEQLVEERTKQLAIERDKAIAASKAKDQFLANMSHEIRTPLNGIIGYLDLLSLSNLTESQKRQVDVTQKSSDLLLELINDILEFSKVEAGEVTLENQPFCLRQCIEDTVESMAYLAYQKNLELPVFISETIPNELLGDEGKLRQILINLIGNAIKFTDAGEVSINASGCWINNNSQFKVVISINDTGIGIDPKSLKKIFHPFVQSDLTDTRKFGGTGLGLSISKGLVEKMGGRMSTQSQLGLGSKFTFSLVLNNPSTKTQRIPPKSLHLPETTIIGIAGTFFDNLDHRLQSWGVNVQKREFTDINLDQLYSSKNKEVFLIDSRTIDDEEIKKIYQLSQNSSKKTVLLCPPSFQDAMSFNNQNSSVKIIFKPVRSNILFETLSQLCLDSTTKKASQVQPPPPSSHQPSCNDFCILLAEDHPINQKLGIAMLTHLGFQFELAHNGAEAVEMARQKKYSAILMDFQMPKMDGLSATKKIRQFDNEIPIIAMTANAFSDVRDKCMAIGMNDYITKPLKIEDLSKSLKKQLGDCNDSIQSEELRSPK